MHWSYVSVHAGCLDMLAGISWYWCIDHLKSQCRVSIDLLWKKHHRLGLAIPQRDNLLHWPEVSMKSASPLPPIMPLLFVVENRAAGCRLNPKHSVLIHRIVLWAYSFFFFVRRYFYDADLQHVQGRNVSFNNYAWGSVFIIHGCKCPHEALGQH